MVYDRLKMLFNAIFRRLIFDEFSKNTTLFYLRNKQTKLTIQLRVGKVYIMLTIETNEVTKIVLA